MTSVYLLGAGASHASPSRLPLMNGFFDQILDADLERFLTSFYGHSDSAKYNLEEVLSYLDIGRELSASWAWGSAPPNVGVAGSSTYQRVVDYVRHRLDVTGTQVCPLHETLVSRLVVGDSVLTLNYDLVMDRAFLAHRGISPPKQYPDRLPKLRSLVGRATYFDATPASVAQGIIDEGLYLKLHGSLDWLWCPVDGCANNAALSGPQFDSDAQVSRVCSECGAELQTFIVPPVASKRITRMKRMSLLWRLAIEVLRSARRIVVIGVSLARTDLHLSWLLAEGRRLTGSLEQLIVVNPSVDAQERSRHLLPVNDDQYQSYQTFEEYLANTN